MSVMENPIITAMRKDLAEGRFEYIRTRFAPEPNAYVHIGHAISMSVTFDAAVSLGGEYNLRIDDTNPSTEREEYVRAIIEDIRWLGYDWGDRLFFASDYFETLHKWAVYLIEQGKAYVCDLSEDEIKEYRGTNVYAEDGTRKTPPGRDSPYRNRSVEENIDLFVRMRRGDFSDGSRTLRAKIDMLHDNLIMRDPVLYRIKHISHFRTGDEWCIYPTYDWAHGQSDSIEGITHSICAIEFRHHRPLYDWFLEQLEIHPPRQLEHSRVNIGNTVTSKRHLLPLVGNGSVSGWDDPRMPTLRGLRRRGYPPEAVRDFCRRIPLSDSKPVSTVDVKLFEHCAREHLNNSTPRAMAVLRPIRLVLTNYPEHTQEMFPAPINPEDPSTGTREVPFGRVLYIEADDFLEDPPPKYHRLSPGREVRLRYAYLITCRDVVKDTEGRIIEVRCTYDPVSRGGVSPDGRKVRGTVHWVSANHSVGCEIRLFDHLMDNEGSVNPKSKTVLTDCRIELESATKEPGYRCQFERIGYFCVDPDSTSEHPVYNQSIPLRDSWARKNAKSQT